MKRLCMMLALAVTVVLMMAGTASAHPRPALSAPHAKACSETDQAVSACDEHRRSGDCPGRTINGEPMY